MILARKRGAAVFFGTVFLQVAVLCFATASFAGAGEIRSGELRAAEIVAPPEPAIRPEIPDLSKTDANGDKLDDRAEAKVAAYEQARAVQAPAVDEEVEAEFVFSGPIGQAELDAFVELGGRVTHIYKAVSYGWNGAVPLSKLRQAVQAAGPGLIGVVEFQPTRCHLDIATRTGRVRPYLWNSGYDGDTSITIAILDTGVDDAHTDLAGRMEYWKDYSTDGSLTPVSVVEHGTHVTGIALGTGTASGVNPTVLHWTDQGVFPSTSGYFYPAPHELAAAVTQFDWTTNMIWQTASGASASHSQTTVSASTYEYAVFFTPIVSSSSPITGTTNNFPNPYPGFLRLYSSYNSSSSKAGGKAYSTANTISADVSNFGVGDSYPLFRGVAPGCRWAGAKVFTNTNIGNTSFGNVALDDMVAQRVAHNIKVLNMSFGLTVPGAEDTTFRAKVNTAVSNGIVACVSMGNDGPSGEASDPSRAGLAISAGSANDSNQLTDYTSIWTDVPDSTEDYKPDLIAPGGTLTSMYSMIMSTDSNDADADLSSFADQTANDYHNIAGTSMASPFTAGCAALVIDAWQTAGHTWSFGSSADALFVKMLLLAGATETNQQREDGTYNPTLERASANATTGTNKDTREGYGMINPDATVEALTIPCGSVVTGTLGSGRTDRRAVGRYLDLTNGVQATMNLTGMAGGDYDLYLYSGSPNAKGNPVILAASATAGTNVNESIAYTPSVTARAYVFVKRVSGSGGFTLSVSNCEPPVAPVSASSDRNNFCADDSGNIQLSVIGGSGDVVRWFDDACGGHSIGTGNPLTIASPTATTTYYGRWENACGASTCASVTVTVLPLPTAPVSASSDRDDFCADDSGNIQLSVSGGSGSVVRWFDDACGGNSIGTGNPLTIASPTATTTYYGRWENTCGASTCASVTVNVREECVPPTVQAAVSRRTHGTVGGLDIDVLTPSGTCDVAVEDRVGGPLELHVWFDEPVFGEGGLDPSDVTVADTAGSTIVVGSVAINGTELTVNLSGVANMTRVRVRLPGIEDTWGNGCADTFCFGVLEGDANASGGVNAFDLTRVRAFLGQTVSQTYVREDVNASGGTINAFDLTVTRARLGNGLAGSCPP